METLEQRLQREAKEYWYKESQYTEQSYLTPDTWGIINEIISHTISETLKEAVRVIDRKDDLLDDMWGLICNVNGGIVEKERPEWYEAFKRIREKYFSQLGPTAITAVEGLQDKK